MDTPQALQVDVSVVIVTYKCKRYALECLESIFAQIGHIQTEVIVVDNASKDGTTEAIRELFPKVFLIENSENQWFRRAANQGIRKSRGQYVVFLGPDTRLITPDGLSRMVSYMKAHPQVGILGVKLLDPDGKVQLDCERFPGLIWALCYYFFIHYLWPENPVKRRWRYNGWDRQDTRAVDAVSGACMMIRRQVFEQIGLFDEGCRIYWEEMDFCRAAHKGGWRVVHLADVEVLHYWKQGGIAITPASTLAPLIEESTLHYYRKYYGFLIYCFLSLLSQGRHFFLKVMRRIRNYAVK